MRTIVWSLMAFLTAITALVAPASAQEVRVPMLVVSEENAEPLKLSAIKSEVQIFGYLAETRLTLTFYNPNHRVLAGDLNFPLPEGTTVSGYALDVGGVMVDGVVVEKHKGRQVYEKIVRQGIDPGLVEWVAGNNFKTRVFPIPARGSRRIMVRYISELVHDPKGTSYHLPLGFKDPVDEFSLRVEVVKPAAKPVVKQGELANFSFEKWRDSYVAETALRNQAVDKDLVIALPEVDRQKVMVQKGSDGEYYFLINDFPNTSKSDQTKQAKNSPGRLVIFWDASGSRGKGDHKRELALLERYLGKQGDKKVEVDLVVFRNEAEKPERFVIEKGNSAKLLAALRAVEYDGGTQMGCLTPDPASAPPDLYLLFGDGLSNFGKEEPTGLKAPVYALSAESSTNHSFLRYLALQTGGEYFNLSRVDDETVVSRLGTSPYSFISATVEGGGADDTYPKAAQPVYGRFALAGKLKSDKAKILLNYGTGGTVSGKADYEVSRTDAAEGDLLRLFWAQKKIEELQVFAKRNEKEVIATGQEYGLVTPGTSLIVLENLNQYVEHKIAPPRTLPEMRSRYFAMVEAQSQKEQQRVTDKLEQVVAMWQKRVDWWNTQFKHPEDSKNKHPEEKQESRQRVFPSISGTGGAQPAPQSPASREDGLLGRVREGVNRVARSLQPGRYQGAPARSEDARGRDGLEDRATNQPPMAVPVAAAKVKAESVPREADQLQKVKSEAEAKPTVSGEGSISIKEWDPSTPYLNELKNAKADMYLKVYMEQRPKYADSPAFYLDCADFLFKQKQEKLAVRVLSNVAELDLENPHLLRVLGHRLTQANLLEPARMVFEEVLRLRPEEPQSYRDLALVMDRLDQHGKAVDLLYQVVTRKWDRFPEIEVVALMELNRTIARAKRAGIQDFPVDPRLIKLLDLDVRIVLTWDADMTDMDLWVIEPSGEKAYYQHRLTTIGGLVSRDVTDGYGPEEYVLKKAMKGPYQVQANYYGSRAPTLTGAVTLQVEVFTNFGRPEEKRRSITLRLKQKQEVISVGQIDFQ